MKRLVLAVVLLAFGVPVRAQSLGDAAAREKERRQKLQGEKPRVVTEEDLKEGSKRGDDSADAKDETDAKGNRGAKDGKASKDGKGTPGNKGNPGNKASKESTTPAGPKASPSPKDPKDKEEPLPRGEHLSEGGLPKLAPKTPEPAPRDEARARLVADIRERYFRADAEVQQAERRLAAAERELESAREAAPSASSNYKNSHAEQNLEQARRALAAAKEKRDAIEDEARREGLYPGDLR